MDYLMLEKGNKSILQIQDFKHLELHEMDLDGLEILELKKNNFSTMDMNARMASPFMREQHRMSSEKMLKQHLETLNESKLETLLKCSMVLPNYREYLTEKNAQFEKELRQFIEGNDSDYKKQNSPKKYDSKSKQQISNSPKITNEKQSLQKQENKEERGQSESKSPKKASIAELTGEKFNKEDQNQMNDKLIKPRKQKIELSNQINLRLNKILNLQGEQDLKFDCQYTSIMLFLSFIEKDYRLYFNLRNYIFLEEKESNKQIEALIKQLLPHE